MLALCSMLYPTDYAKNYAGIMGAGQNSTATRAQVIASMHINNANFFCLISISG